MDDRRFGDVDLGVAGPEHVLGQQMIFGVGDVPERDLVPGRPGHAPVGIGEEPQVAHEVARRGIPGLGRQRVDPGPAV